MSEPYALITSESIQLEEIKKVLEACGAIQTNGLEWRISQGARHVWIYPSPNGLNDLETDELFLITQTLGGTPLCEWILDVNSAEGSEALAIDFAVKCAERWPLVVYDLESRVLTVDELRRLTLLGHGFHESLNS